MDVRGALYVAELLMNEVRSGLRKARHGPLSPQLGFELQLCHLGQQRHVSRGREKVDLVLAPARIQRIELTDASDPAATFCAR